MNLDDAKCRACGRWFDEGCEDPRACSQGRSEIAESLAEYYAEQRRQEAERVDADYDAHREEMRTW